MGEREGAWAQQTRDMPIAVSHGLHSHPHDSAKEGLLQLNLCIFLVPVFIAKNCRAFFAISRWEIVSDAKTKVPFPGLR